METRAFVPDVFTRKCDVNVIFALNSPFTKVNMKVPHTFATHLLKISVIFTKNAGKQIFCTSFQLIFLSMKNARNLVANTRSRMKNTDAAGRGRGLNFPFSINFSTPQ